MFLVKVFLLVPQSIEIYTFLESIYYDMKIKEEADL
jgi:hypothetical protein